MLASILTPSCSVVQRAAHVTSATCVLVGTSRMLKAALARPRRTQWSVELETRVRAHLVVDESVTRGV